MIYEHQASTGAEGGAATSLPQISNRPRCHFWYLCARGDFCGAPRGGVSCVRPEPPAAVLGRYPENPSSSPAQAQINSTVCRADLVGSDRGHDAGASAERISPQNGTPKRFNRARAPASAPRRYPTLPRSASCCSQVRGNRRYSLQPTIPQVRACQYSWLSESPSVVHF